MCSQYAISRTKRQEAEQQVSRLNTSIETYLEPLLERLDAWLDRRLVDTFAQGIRTIIQARTQAPGLVLSELGATLLSGEQAQAGEKRWHRLLGSPKWSEELIKAFAWTGAEQRLHELRAQGQECFVIWDGSVLEKPESQKAEDLCAVKSSKAARRKKARKGAFNQPGGKPIVVPGLEWSACVLAGLTGRPELVRMEFWSRKGPEATTLRQEEQRLLGPVARAWGKLVLHVFDRGYASGPWIRTLGQYEVEFLIRWKKGHHFCDEQGREQSLGQIGKQHRSWAFRWLWDEKSQQKRKTGIVAVRVRHADSSGALWVVIVRRGGEPWYLVTNRPIETEEQAWQCYYAYCRRWQVETVFRYEKCELGIETIRLWKREKRNKLLQMVALVHTVLLQLLSEEQQDLLAWLLRHYCPRRGRKQQQAKVPLYRLRWALSRLFAEWRPVWRVPATVRSSMGSRRGANLCSQNSG